MRRVAAIAIVIAACSQHESRARLPDPMEAARRCAKALNDASTSDPALHQRTIVDGCRETIVEPVCRDAWGAYATTPPAERAHYLLVKCAEAYCAKLPEPRPQACLGIADRADAVLVQGRELWHAIHLFDLGKDATALIEAVPEHVVQVPAPTQLPSQSVSWRIPLVTITTDAVTLEWRAPDGGTERALAIPLAQFDCKPLRDALANEVVRTWPNTVRPTRSKQLLLVADKDAIYETVLKVWKCAEDRTGVRQLYPDVTFSTQ